MLGWAAVYFPMFEKALAEEGLPTDLKYLSIVESALNPAARRFGLRPVDRVRGPAGAHGVRVRPLSRGACD